MKYEVKTKFVFSGTFTIEADNAAQAKEFVHQHCGMVIGGGIHSTLSPDEWIGILTFTLKRSLSAQGG
jgi:hypothetical protein